MKSAISIFFKDWKSELRTRYSVNSLAMFIIVAISVILFSVKDEPLSPYLTAGLLWTVIFFSAMSGLSRTFVSEEERGTFLILQIIASPLNVFSGKLLFNTLLVFLINSIITLLFSLLFSAFIIKNIYLFTAVFFLGNFGIAVSSTVIAAIISKAGAKGTLYPVLSFPVLLPLILILSELTNFSIDGKSVEESLTEILVIICYDVIMLTVSVMLFDFIWKD